MLLGVVLLLHWGTLALLAEAIHGPAPLTQLAEPMFTRIIEPTQAPAILATSLSAPPTIARPKPPKKALSTAEATATPSQITAVASPPTPDSNRPTELLPESVEPLAPGVAAPEAASAETSPPTDTWPPDTRLTYRLTGNYRGELTGSARVQWQHVAAANSGAEGKSDPRRYQVQLEMSLSSFVVATMTSQGKITETGLLPEVYEEKLPGNVRRVTFEDAQIRFNTGRVDVRPTTVQDTASQFVELSHRFATGLETLRAGAEVRVWLARPGGLDFWTYDVLAPEILQTPMLGPIEAFHLKPRPLANPRGPIIAEMWFAPSLQYLPVRVRIAMGGNNFVDLMVERIEQSEAPKLNPATESQSRDPI